VSKISVLLGLMVTRSPLIVTLASPAGMLSVTLPFYARRIVTLPIPAATGGLNPSTKFVLAETPAASSAGCVLISVSGSKHTLVFGLHRAVTQSCAAWHVDPTGPDSHAPWSQSSLWQSLSAAHVESTYPGKHSPASH